MNKNVKAKLLSLLLAFVMLVGLVPSTALALFEPPKADVADSIPGAYTVPAGVTMTRYTGKYVDSNYDIGCDFLFVVKKDGRYFAMKEPAASDEEYATIPAIDVTDWISADGQTASIPADPGDVAFFYSEHHFVDEYAGIWQDTINGNSILASSCTREWDEGYDNILSEKLNFKVYDIDQECSNSLYWSTEGSSGYGTIADRTSFYKNYKNYYVDYVVDVRSDSAGGYCFYWRDINGDNPVIYSELETYGRQGDEVEGYLFWLPCRHNAQIIHANYDAPTCTDKGCLEYWYCTGCERYFKDAALTQLHDLYEGFDAPLDPPGISEPILPALGHDWDGDNCANCGADLPVYSKITNMEQLSSLSENTTFLLVAQYGGKTYVMDGGDPLEMAKMMDGNDDGIPDIIEIDLNNNGTSDCLEIDEDGNGVWDYLETDLMNLDEGIIDWYDYDEYFSSLDFNALFEDVYSANAFDGGVMGALEVTPNADGTITLSGDRMFSFAFTPMHTSEDIESQLDFYEEEGEEAKNAIRKELENNFLMNCPNLWLQPYFCWSDRQYQQERLDSGDQTAWNLYFYDDIKDVTVEMELWDDDLASFVVKEVSLIPDNFALSEGCVFLYSIYDMYGGAWNPWYVECDLSASVRLRDVDGTIDFVGGSYIYDYEISEQIDLCTGIQTCVYLYASDPGADAVCSHRWDEGVVTRPATADTKGTKLYTCTLCDETCTLTYSAEPCIHTCPVCGLCLDVDYETSCTADRCTCDDPETLPVYEEVTASAVTSGGDVVTVDVYEVPADAGTAYADQVAAVVGGDQIQAVFDVTVPEVLEAGETVTVTVEVGTAIAKNIQNGIFWLEHVEGNGSEIVPIDGVNATNGTVTFTTNSFSPFVVASRSTLRYGWQVLAQMGNSAALLDAYDRIVTGLTRADTQIDLDYTNCPITDEEFSAVLELALSDYPEFFWVDSAYSYQSMGGTISAYLPAYLLTGSELTAAQDTFSDAVDALLTGLEGKTDYEISLILHDRVADAVEYVSTENDQTAYGALVEGQAVCAGYAHAYQYLMIRAGIPAWTVSGASFPPAGGTSIPHAWNMAELDGSWYHTDVTWDDQGSTFYYDYLNVTTGRILESHIMSEPYLTYAPLCTADDANYFTVNGGISDSFDLDAAVEHLKDNACVGRFLVTGNVEQFISDAGANLGSIMTALDITEQTSLSISYLDREVIITICVYGDVNGDGKITVQDLAWLRKHLANKDPLTLKSTVAVGPGADANGDGQITVRDLAMVRKYLANKNPATGQSSITLGPQG